MIIDSFIVRVTRPALARYLTSHPDEDYVYFAMWMGDLFTQWSFEYPLELQADRLVELGWRVFGVPHLALADSLKLFGGRATVGLWRSGELRRI